MTSVKPAPDPAYPPPAGQGQGPPPAGYSNQPPPAGYSNQPPPAYNYGGPGMAQGQPGTTVVMLQGGGFRDVPVTMKCSYCQANIVTGLSYQVGSMVILISILLFIFGAWLCMFIPCCIDACKDVCHHCPNCHAQVGRYNRM